MLRVLENVFIISILIYGTVKLIEFFSPKAKAKRREKGLAELHEKAKKAAQDKKDIQDAAKKNQDILDEIDNTLNN